MRESVVALGDRCTVQLFSSLKKTGIEEAERVLCRLAGHAGRDCGGAPAAPTKRVLAPAKRNPGWRPSGAGKAERKAAAERKKKAR